MQSSFNININFTLHFHYNSDSHSNNLTKNQHPVSIVHTVAKAEAKTPTVPYHAEKNPWSNCKSKTKSVRMNLFSRVVCFKVKTRISAAWFLLRYLWGLLPVIYFLRSSGLNKEFTFRFWNSHPFLWISLTSSNISLDYSYLFCVLLILFGSTRNF